jgi:hypothetical protein
VRAPYTTLGGRSGGFQHAESCWHLAARQGSGVKMGRNPYT